MGGLAPLGLVRPCPYPLLNSFGTLLILSHLRLGADNFHQLKRG